MEQIPNTENIEFKDKFIERYSQLTDWELFKKYSLAFLRRSIRVNTLKGNVAEVKKDIEAKGWKLKQIPWCKEGFWIVGGPPHDKEDRERRDVGNLLEHHLGKIYVQEAASMIPPLVLNPKPGELVLDMCTQLNADIYIFGEKGKDYADVDVYKSKGVHPYFQSYNHPVYKQIKGEFEPFMSVLDLIFNQGKDSKEIIMSNNINRFNLIN